MSILHLQIQQTLMIIAFPPCSLQHLHLVLIQPPAHGLLQLPPTNLRQGLFLLGRLELGLKPGLHTYAHGRIECDFVLVAAYFCRRSRLGRRVGLDGDERLAEGLQLKSAGGVGRGDDVEALEGGNGFRRGG